MSPQGIISTVAGHASAGFGGDGGPAKLAKIDAPTRLAVGPDGSIYIADTGNQRRPLDRLGGDHHHSRGHRHRRLQRRRRPRHRGRSSAIPTAVAVGPDGALYVADSFNQCIRRVVSALPGSSVSDIFLPSTDGSEVYVFSGGGRHLRTLEALTGAQRAAVHLRRRRTSPRAVDDGDGNVTTVERDSNGVPTAIVAPFGQRTALTVDANGFLSSIKDPANETIGLTSDRRGSADDSSPTRGAASTRSPTTPQGRLTKDEDPGGRLQDAGPDRDDHVDRRSSVSTELGRTTTYADGASIERRATPRDHRAERRAAPRSPSTTDGSRPARPTRTGRWKSSCRARIRAGACRRRFSLPTPARRRAVWRRPSPAAARRRCRAPTDPLEPPDPDRHTRDQRPHLEDRVSRQPARLSAAPARSAVSVTATLDARGRVVSAAGGGASP